MATGQLTYKGTVYPWHCDHMGHMNVMWYVGKFDEATWALFASVALTTRRFNNDGIGMAALDQRLAYKREAMPGDTLEIYSRPVEVKGKTIRFIHEMIDCESGATVATCELVATCLDTQARKSVSLPDDVRDKALALLGSSIPEN